MKPPSNKVALPPEGLADTAHRQHHTEDFHLNAPEVLSPLAAYSPVILFPPIQIPVERFPRGAGFRAPPPCCDVVFRGSGIDIPEGRESS